MNTPFETGRRWYRMGANRVENLYPYRSPAWHEYYQGWRYENATNPS